jgi:ubiquinone/menaquinone biosynthesis C-methylase UbiE
MEKDVKEWLDKGGMLFLRSIGIKEGQIVLDFGCNVGHYTIPAAKVVGKKGIVYAVDSDTKSLNELIQISEKEGLRNIVPVQTKSARLKVNLKDESIDAILLYDVLHYMEVTKRNKLYSDCYRLLKDKALLSVYPKHNKLDEPLWNLSDMQLEDVIGEIGSAEFHLEGKYYKRLIHDNNYSMGYILNFTKNRKGGCYKNK